VTLTAPGTLRALRLDPRALDRDALSAWGDLADRAAEPNPFFRPEFMLANIEERAIPAELLVIMDRERWVACLPVVHRAATREFPLSSLTAVTDEYSFSGTPLMDRDQLDQAADAFVRLVRAQRRAAVVAISVWETNGPVGQAIEGAARRHGVPLGHAAPFERAGWRREAEPHFPSPAFNRSDRRELARRTRLLETELGARPRVVDRSGDPAAWEQFLALENTGWKAAAGTSLASSERDRAFFLRMCGGMSRAGCLEIVALEITEQTLAMECHLIDGQAFWSFKIAFDPTYAKYSPGTLLKYRVIEALEARPFVIADSCAMPDNAHMNRLWPNRRRMDTLLIGSGGVAGRLLPVLLWSRRAMRRGRHIVSRT
jgi:CelD/BcsL family acetyltransferase involved in cellulose biosynthesis